MLAVRSAGMIPALLIELFLVSDSATIGSRDHLFQTYHICRVGNQPEGTQQPRQAHTIKRLNPIRHLTQIIFLLALLAPASLTIAAAPGGIKDSDVTIARIKYGGGGDWYSNPSSIPNLLKFTQRETGIATSEGEAVVELTNPKLFQYPILYMNGHGNISFTAREVEMLRQYFEAGGFLIADDNYGMDASFRREIKRVVDNELVELPFSHPIYSSYFQFPSGLPKIHEHDGKPAQGFGLFLDGRMVAFYSYQADLGDGWEDPEVHNDPPEKRLAALRMGANLLVWRLRGGK